MLIKNATVITWQTPNQILAGYSISIENGRVVKMGPDAELAKEYPQEKAIDARGQLVMPGNICAHTHFYGAYSRGMGIPGPAPADFPQILDSLWWKLDKALDAKAVEMSAWVCILDAIRHGTTTLIDHHASPNAIDGSLDVIADVVEQAGIRASLCYEVTDRDGEARRDAGIRENARFIRRMKTQKPTGRLSAMFGLHASLTLSEETLDRCAAANVDGAGYHIHVAEHPVDEFDSLEKYGKRVIDRLADHGMLNDHSIVAHAVHIDGREMQLLQEAGTWVTHQPRSNMNNAVGVAPVESYLRYGIKVGLGNDGFSNAMWEEWKAAYLVHKLWNRDPRMMPANKIAQMAIYNNAALATQLFECEPLGVIQPGAAADLIFVDYQPFTPLNPGNLPWHMVFGFHESMITSTLVAGTFLMKDHQFVQLDAEKISHEARSIAPAVWERYQQQF